MSRQRHLPTVMQYCGTLSTLMRVISAATESGEINTASASESAPYQSTQPATLLLRYSMAIDKQAALIVVGGVAALAGV